MNLSHVHDFVKSRTDFFYRYKKCVYCNKINIFKAVYKCICTKICHRKCHKKNFIEKELKCTEKVEQIKSPSEINKNEIIAAQKSVHEIREKKEDEFQYKEKEQESFLQTYQEPNTSLDVKILKVLTVSMSETDGLRNGKPTPAESGRRMLLDQIKEIDILDEDMTDINSEVGESVLDGEKYDDDEPIYGIKEYLKEIEQISIVQSKIIGNCYSAYCIPNLYKSILRICKYFPIWTEVMNEKFQTPYVIASSASVESDFSDLKSRIVRFEIKPMSADRFVAKHLKSIEKSSVLFQSSHLRNKNSELSKQSDLEVDVEKENLISDSLTVGSSLTQINTLIPMSEESPIESIQNEKSILNESFDSLDIKRLGSTSSKETYPHLEEIEPLTSLNLSEDSSYSHTLHMNGNIAATLTVAAQRYSVINTCPFDSLAVIITMAYTDLTTYKSFIDSSENNMLKFCKSLALYGSTEKTYIDRLELLKPIFKSYDDISGIKVIDARCNVSFVAMKLFVNTPSAIEELRCTTDGCINSNKDIESPTIILSCTNFNNLQKSLDNYTMEQMYECSYCFKSLFSKRTVKHHLLIESDIFTEYQSIPLSTIPTQLEANNVKYTLYGIIGYHSEHYISHIRRSEDRWEIYNDMETNIKISKSKCLSTSPHLTVYIQI